MKVRFTATDSPYQVGQEYELRAAEAKKFIRHGVAVAVAADVEENQDVLDLGLLEPVDEEES